MINALTANTSSLVSTDNTSLLMTRIAERLYADMRQRTDAVDEAYQERINTVSARSGTVSGRLRDVEKVVDGADKAKEVIDDIKVLLRDMKTIVAKADNNPAAAELYAKQFNEKIQEINQAANRYSGDYNLVGRPDDHTLLPDKKRIQVSDNGVNLELQGLYAGTSFNITGTGASEGQYFQNKATSNVMYQGDRIGDDDPDSVIGHSQGRISNVVVGSDDSISFDIDGGASSFTGTLQKGGLELMPSWFYEDLATTDGIAAAKTAILKAESSLRAVSFSVSSIKARAQPVLRSLESEKQELTEEISGLARDQFTKVAEIEDAARLEYDAVASSLSIKASALNGYQSILAGAGSGSGLFVNLRS